MFLVGVGFCSCTAVLKITFVDLKTGVCTLQIQNQPSKENKCINQFSKKIKPVTLEKVNMNQTFF